MNKIVYEIILLGKYSKYFKTLNISCLNSSTNSSLTLIPQIVHSHQL